MIKPVVIIMAGGYGERLWPRSRRKFPKQFLNITGSLSLLQETINHATQFTSADRIYIVTNRNYIEETKKQTQMFHNINIIAEPESRNTAAAVVLATIYIRKDLPHEDPVLLLLSSDNLIKNPQELYRAVALGFSFCVKSGRGVIFGIPPNRPETGCGYIELGELLDGRENDFVYRVARFKEKPNRETAEGYLKSGKYLWNAGTFIWKLSGLLAELKIYLPQLTSNLENLRLYIGADNENSKLQEAYASLPPLSIDYGLLEKSNNLAVISTDFGLEDLGSWEALNRVLEQDEARNVIQGGFCGLDTNDCIIFSPDKMVAAFGLSHLVIVETGDVLLVCERERLPEIKKLLLELRFRGYERFL